MLNFDFGDICSCAGILDEEHDECVKNTFQILFDLLPVYMHAFCLFLCHEANHAAPHVLVKCGVLLWRALV